MKKDAPKTSADLRKQAEDTAALSPRNCEKLSPEATRLMLHELRVHQIELEMQNEELRRTQAELTAARARYFDLYDLAPMGYVSLNEKGMIQEVNLTASTLLGAVRSTLLVKLFSQFILTDDQDKFYLMRKQLVATGEPQEVELRMKKHDGASFWAQLSATLAYESEEARVCRIALIDISARKHAEAELGKLDKLQSIGTLAGGIAHDFNNLLQGLYGNIALAKEDLPKGHTSYEFLAEAEKSMTRAVRLTKQLLTFAKGGAPIKGNLRLGTLIEEVARFDLSGSNVSLVYKQVEDLWLVEADKGQIQQVFSNLVINAREAMPKGGCLTLHLENAELPAKSFIGQSQGHYVKVLVQDEGTGIDPKVIDHIFDPYFTTKQTGRGLGLATVWSVITKHNGHIEVDSELGKGTTFTCYLPTATSSLLTHPEIPAAVPPRFAQGARILVMDDEESIGNLAKKMLNSCGCSTAIAPNGSETVAHYKQAMEAGTPFDLVILDLTIPGEAGGKDVIQELHRLDPHVRAIVSSGYAEDPVMANPTAHGFKDTVAKPYSASELQDVVARVLNHEILDARSSGS